MSSKKQIRFILISSLLLVIALWVPNEVNATPGATINVTIPTDEYNLTGSGEGCSLREALHAAMFNQAFGGCPAGTSGDLDTITLYDFDTYYLSISGTEDENASGDLDIFLPPYIPVDNPLLLQGSAPDLTTISGETLSHPVDRVFDIMENTTVLINSLTIREGHAIMGPDTRTSEGGCIYNNGTLTLNSINLFFCTGIASETASNGGAIANYGNLVINGANIWDNEIEKITTAGNESGKGGGIYNNGYAEINYVFVSGNRTHGVYANGGGIANYGTMYLNHSIVDHNYIRDLSEEPLNFSGSGGGIFNGGDIYINFSVIRQNFIEFANFSGNGAGLHNSGSATIDHAWIFGNYFTTKEDVCHEGGNGGGISNYEDMIISNSTINQNDTGINCINGSNGGGISTRMSSTLSITTSTLSGNKTWGGYGGGIYSSNIANIIDSTIAYNTQNGSSGLGGGVFSVYNLLTISNSIVANNLVVIDTVPVNGDCETSESYHITSGGYNLVQYPDGCVFNGDTGSNIYYIDPMLGELKDNGGFAWTHALLPISLAINTGSCLPGYDQRGMTRPIGTCDRGAYEFRWQSFLPAIAK